MAFKQNKSQEEAISTIHGPVMIVSCPGSGKTTTLIRRIHHMIEEHISPTEILMVTFSRAAAMEMRDKYIKFFGTNPGISFQTIHSLCFNLLLKEGRYKKEDVLQENDKMDYLVNILRTYPQAEGDLWELAKTVATNITSIKNNYVEMVNFQPNELDKELFVSIYYKYEQWKEEMNRIDFDDMLTACKKMFEKSDAIREKWSNHFRYIQCDEYQDTNMIQRDILYMLAGRNRNLCVVGDDDQSIYRFRGARPEIMLHFMDDFPDAKKIMMGINYRSAGEIVEKSAKIIEKNKIRYGKRFISQRGLDGTAGYTEYIRAANKQDEMERVINIIRKKHEEGTEYNEMAILFRTNHQAVLPVSSLSSADIPFYAVDSVKCIYDNWIFNDIRTYTELSCGMYDDEKDMHKKILSVLNKPNRYLNPDDFTDVEFSKSGFHEAIYPMFKATYWKYQQALEEVDTWIRLFGPSEILETDHPSIIFERIRGPRSIHFDKHIRDMAKFRHMDPDDYFEELAELQEDAKRFDTIKEWFEHADWMSRFIKEESMKKNPEGVILATMHKSKGLEWNIVFIIDCNDGVTPHKNSLEGQSLEEERRLFYVAMTRAKNELYCINSNKAESAFIKEAKLQTVNEKKEGAEIPKYLPGKKIEHKTFGTGQLVSYSPNMITVRFPKKGIQMFPFPKSFKDGVLKYI